MITVIDVTLRSFEIIYTIDETIKGKTYRSINSEPYCDIHADNQDKSLSNFRGNHFAKEYDAIAKHLINS